MNSLALFRSAVFTLTMAGLALAGGMIQTPAQAQTLERIQKEGVVRIGVYGDQPPWSAVDASGQHVGYDVDLARLIGQALGVRVEFVLQDVAARIPNLLLGKVDLQMAVMGMYPERARVVQYSKPTAGQQIVLFASRKHRISQIEDARPLRIGVPRGAAQDVAITQLLGEASTIRRFNDNSAVIQALVSGQVDAIGGDTSYRVMLNRAAPNNDYEQKLVFNEQWQGIATRPGDKKINEWLNRFIDTIKADGRLEAISQKHLAQPLPVFPESLEGIPFTVP